MHVRLCDYTIIYVIAFPFISHDLDFFRSYSHKMKSERLKMLIDCYAVLG